ncbi:MAG TPA: ATP-binding protein, partial [Kofleriaceae bacterium]|nr:ATP-binding protein [Kofleriaceae bacterium]
TRRADRLIEIVQQLSLARSIDAVTEIVRRSARELTGADGATFVLRDGANCFYADEDAIEPLWKGKRFPLESCVSGWAMLHREQVVIEDIYADSRVPHEAYRPTFVKSLAMVPIRIKSPVGAIGTYWATKRQASHSELRLLQALADSTSIAIENVQLYTDLERRVRERTEALEFANAELDAFASRVSHDLRSPIRAIDGFSAALMEDHGDTMDPNAVHYLKRVRTSARNMGQLVDNLLQLARVGRGELDVGPVDLTHLAHEIAAELVERDPRRFVAFDIAPNLTAAADKGLVRIVLENILSNAWKYTQRTLEARVTFDEPTPGTFRVSDNGAGFEPAKAGALFQPFTRLHSDREFAGTGIGLATVKRIIERHGGRVWAAGAVGAGAQFSFTFGP